MDSEYVSNPVTVKTEEFDKAFKEAFTSNIDPNQDWGFGLAKKASASTRAVNTNAADGNSAWALPATITEAERQKVVAHFADKSNYTANVLPGYINYWVQHVDIGNHSYTTEPDNNNVQATVKANEQMDYLFVMEDDKMVHIERFNASSGSKMFMQNSESRVFGYHNSYASEYVSNRYLIQIIDGAYYVGFDYAGTTENKVVKPDGIYDDWIIKLVPGELKTSNGEVETPDLSEDKDDNADDEEVDNVNNPGNQSDITTENVDWQQEITRTEYFKKRRLLQYGRVFCEDLGANYASNHKDFDYNDVVFDAYLNRDEVWKKKTKINVYEVRKYEKREGLERQKIVDNVPQVQNVEKTITIDGKDSVIIVEEPVMETYNALVYKESEKRIPENEVLTTWERVKSAEEIKTNGLDTEGKGRRYYANILLMACGATKPIKVGAQRDGTPVKEVHEAFGGYSVDCIINTFDTHSEREGGFGYHELANPKMLDEMEIPIQYITVSNPTIKDIPIFIQGGTAEARTLEAEQGGIPQKFMSTNQDKWTSERCFLGDAYPNFVNWAQDRDAVFSANSNPDYLYNNNFPIYQQTDLPFDVATGAASTICKNIEVTQDTAVVKTDFIIRETEDGSAWPTEGWELYDKDDDGPRTGTVTGGGGGGTGASWSKSDYDGSNGGNNSTAEISASTFTSAGFVSTKGATLTVTGNYTNWSWTVKVMDKDYTILAGPYNQDNPGNAIVTYNDNNNQRASSGNVTVQVTLTQSAISSILNNGLRIDLSNFVSGKANVTLKQ